MISIVVLDYKSAQNTIIYIDHILQHIADKSELTFVIVDNSVDDANYRKLKSVLKDSDNILEDKRNTILSFWRNTAIPVALCQNDNNGGYAQGNNVGAYLAVDVFSPSMIIISNNDIEVIDETMNFQEFQDIFDRYPDVGCIGPKIIGKDGIDQSPSKYISLYERWIRMGFLFPFGKLLNKSADEVIINRNSSKVYRVMGSFLVLRTIAFLDCNGFDESTFLFAEEPILSERLRRAGFSTYYYNKIRLLHNHGATINNNYRTIDKIRMRFRSELYYYKNYTSTNRALIFIAKIVFEFYIIKYRLLQVMKIKE